MRISGTQTVWSSLATPFTCLASSSHGCGAIFLTIFMPGTLYSTWWGGIISKIKVDSTALSLSTGLRTFFPWGGDLKSSHRFDVYQCCHYAGHAHSLGLRTGNFVGRVFLVFKLKTLSISKYINSVHRSNALAISHNCCTTQRYDIF